MRILHPCIKLGPGACALLLLAVGCQTPSARRAAEAERHRRVEEKLESIQAQVHALNDLTSLRTQMSTLSDQVRRMETPSASAAGKSTGTALAGDAEDAKAVPSKIDARCIRVPVSAEAVQRALKAAGYDPGPIDGRVGAKTSAAIRRFQRDNKLKVDGIVGQATWAKLSARVEK